MALIIQANTISGKIIEGARWEVTSLSAFQKSQRVSIELPIKDPNLLQYLKKNANSECMIDGDRDNYTVIMSCLVSDVRHMIFTHQKTVDTMVTIQPTNRLVEHVMTYILCQTKCDPRFVRIIRGDVQAE